MIRVSAPDAGSPGHDFRWYGRFDPAWSSLVEQGLPHLLLALLDPADASLHGGANGLSDRRAAPATHGAPVGLRDVPGGSAGERPSQLPERLAWLMTALMFVTDRLLAWRRT